MKSTGLLLSDRTEQASEDYNLSSQKASMMVRVQSRSRRLKGGGNYQREIREHQKHQKQGL